MHVTIVDVNFCDSLESVYVKYKSCVSTAHELPINTWVFVGLNMVVNSV